MNRIIYSLKQALNHRAQLQTILKSQAQSCKSVCEITPMLLQDRQIQALVLDFDGILAPHANPMPESYIAHWLQELQNSWSGEIFIFSNNPSAARQIYFKTHFPKIQFIRDMPRKPYPEGLLHIANLTDLAPQQVLMVDDRLLTGILAGILAHTQVLWISSPVQDFKAHFFKETWFALLRWLDKILLL